MNAGEYKWGVDLGGTKIEAVVLDKTGNVAMRMRRPTQADKGYEHILAQIAGLLAEIEKTSGLTKPQKIGMGTPGTTDPATGKIKNSNTVCLIGHTLIADLEKQIGRIVVTANDANCCALAEATLGAARGERVVVGLILGTGVGSGIVIDGKVLAGLHGIAGEWGHNPMRGETTPCYCGLAGCVETVISGPALEKFHTDLSGTKLRLPDIVIAAAAGDSYAVATIERLRNKFAEAIAAYINLLDPDAIVIGGGVGNIPILYAMETRTIIVRHLLNPELHTKILPPSLGDSAGVFGAAMLVE